MLTLVDEDKMRYAEDIDKYIHAYMPDKTEDPKLYEIVTKNMVHGPCGPYKPDAMCMKDGKCSKHYPKEFCEETIVKEDGYPEYKRPNNGLYVKKGANELDNRWVVPHSPYLLKRYYLFFIYIFFKLILSYICNLYRFNCHINVEHVLSIKMLKYFFKYMNKGPDQAYMELNEIVELDETREFFKMRYVGPTDAYWKIAGKIMQEKDYSVIINYIYFH